MRSQGGNRKKFPDKKNPPMPPAGG